MLTNWILTAIFVLIFAGLFARAWKRHFSILKNAAEEIKATTVSLQQIPEEEYEIRFEEIKKSVQKNPFLSESWGSFTASLAKITENDHHKMFSPTSASDFFRFSDTTRAMNISYWQNFSGTFTGVGIGGTFLGLVIGLFNVDLASSDVLVLKEGIGNLLNGIYIAFITSLIGIVCAILYGIVHQRHIERLQKAVIEFSEHVEKMYPCISAEQWLAKSYEENSEQTKQLKNIGQDTANAFETLFEKQMGPAFDELCEKLSAALDQKLSPVFTDLKNAIEGLNKNGMGSIAQALDDSQKTTQQNNESIRKAIEKIGAMPEDVVKIFREQKQEAAQMAQNIKEQTAGQMEALFTFLQNNQKDMTQNLKDAKELTQQITQKMDTALKNFRDTMENSLQESLRTQQQATASINQEAGTRMGEQIEAFSTTLQQVQSGMTETLTALQGMSQESKALTLSTMHNLSTTLKTSAEEAAHRQQEVANNMAEQVSKTVEVWSKKQKDVASNMEKRVEGILLTLAQNSSMIVKQMNETGAEAQKNMQIFAEKAKQAMETTITSLRTALDGNNKAMETAQSRINQICMTMSILIQEMKDSGNTFKDAAKPVEAATKELQETLHKTTKEAKTLHENVDKQLQQLIEHGKQNESNLQHLTEELELAQKTSADAWTRYKNNFENVGGELERATKVISENLANYNDTMSRNMQNQFSDFSTQVDHAVGQLKSAIDGLGELIDDLTGKEHNRRG